MSLNEKTRKKSRDGQSKLICTRLKIRRIRRIRRIILRNVLLALSYQEMQSRMEVIKL